MSAFASPAARSPIYGRSVTADTDLSLIYAKTWPSIHIILVNLGRLYDGGAVGGVKRAGAERRGAAVSGRGRRPETAPRAPRLRRGGTARRHR